MPKINRTKGKVVRSHAQKRAIQNTDAKLTGAQVKRVTNRAAKRGLLNLMGVKPKGKRQR